MRSNVCALQLSNVLVQVNIYLKKYDKIAWDGSDPKEASKALEVELDKLRTGGKVNKSRLELLFAPTGIIQECAIANGWEKEFLNLSEKFDRYIRKVE